MGLTRDESRSSFFEDSVHAGKKMFLHDGAYKGLPDGTLRDIRSAHPVSVDHDRTPIIGFLSPPAIFSQIVEYGAEKARMPWWKTFWLGILAGIYLSFGGAWAYAVGGRLPEIQQNNPGLQELIFACFGLPLGLGLIVICGAELYTTNAAYMAAAFYEGRANIMQVAKSWFCSFFGNLTGSLLVVWLLDETLLFATPEAKKWPFQLAALKTGQPFGTEICRAMFCNFLVCLAVWQATAAQDIMGKIFGIFFPVAAFVSISFSHVVANMFWVPFAIKCGAPISVGKYIGSSMAPDYIGNTIAAAFFLSGSYSFIYGTLAGRVFALFSRLTGYHREVHVGQDHTVERDGKLQTASGIAAERGDIHGVHGTP